jgi:endonuclease III
VLEKLIYPAGFYKTKVKTIQAICERLVNEFNGQVPDTIEDLLTFNGVGRKTANLVVGLGHHLPAICVDVHVHRICNRLGVVESHPG